MLTGTMGSGLRRNDDSWVPGIMFAPSSLLDYDAYKNL